MVDATSFGLFVSSVEGQPVTRYGTGTLIGATRNPATPTQVDYDPKIVVALPLDEVARYRREYSDAIRDGSLKERTALEWAKQEDALIEASRPKKTEKK